MCWVRRWGGGSIVLLSFWSESNQSFSIFTNEPPSPNSHISSTSPFFHLIHESHFLSHPPTHLLCHLEVLCDLYRIMSCSQAVMWLYTQRKLRKTKNKKDRSGGVKNHLYTTSVGIATAILLYYSSLYYIIHFLVHSLHLTYCMLQDRTVD